MRSRSASDCLAKRLAFWSCRSRTCAVACRSAARARASPSCCCCCAPTGANQTTHKRMKNAEVKAKRPSEARIEVHQHDVDGVGKPTDFGRTQPTGSEIHAI